MGLTVCESKKEFKPIPEGIYEAKCISLIDIGEQETTYNNKISYKNQVVVEWEIPEIVIEYEDKITKEKKKFNKVIRKTYTANLNGTTNHLRNDLISWRGKAFTPEELKAFNLKNILGKDCNIQIIHEKKEDGTAFEKKNILPVMGKNHKSIEVENALKSFDFDTDDISKMAEFPDWLTEKMVKSRTYQKLIYSGDSTDECENINADELIGEDEIPF